MLCLLLAGMSLATLDLAAQADAHVESRAGLLRATPGVPATRTVAYELVPSLELSAETAASLFELGYRPEIGAATFGALGQTSVLHHGRLLATRETRAGDLMRFEATGLLGEMTYDRATRLLAEADELYLNVPGGGDLRYANADASLGFHVRTSPVVTRELILGGGYTGPAPGDASSDLLPQRRGSALARQRLALSPVDELAVELGGGVIDFGQGPRYWTLTPAGTYRTRPTRKDRLEARLGVQLTLMRRAAERGPVPQREGVVLMPVGRLSAEHQLVRRRSATLTAGASVGVLPYLDPFRADLLPRAVLLVSTRLEASDGSRAVATAHVYQALDPTNGAVELGDRQHTIVALGLAASRPLFGPWRAEAGGIVSSRREIYYGAERRLDQLELLGYVALGAGLQVD